MSVPSGASVATFITAVLVVCLLVTAAVPAGVAGGFSQPAPETEAVNAAEAETATSGLKSVHARDTSTTGLNTTEREATGSDNGVPPGLRSAEEPVTVVVRFADDTAGGPQAVGSDSAEGATLSAKALKTTASNTQAEFRRFAARTPGVSIERGFWLANAMLVTVDTDSVPIDRLLEVQGVERVHENFRVELDSVAIEPGSASSVGAPASGTTPELLTTTAVDATYGVEMVRAPEVWQAFETRGAGATVAVLDTGINRSHPDLTVDGWVAYDSEGNLVSEGPENAYDNDGHGTHVAGTVTGGNTSGTAIGVAPEASLYGVKVLNDTGTGTFSQVLAGMEYATDNESVDVIQMSLGSSGYFSAFIQPVQNARNSGKIVVASAGNSGKGSSSSPANVYDSLAVGAVDDTRDAATTSSGETITTADAWGSNAPDHWPDEYVVPDVSAPGVDVKSASASGGYEQKSGTSMAAPHVSGVVALMLSASTRNVTSDELSQMLRDTAVHPTDATKPDDRYGTGIVDGYAAVSRITENRSNLTVTAFDAPDQATPGDTLNTTATINNTGADPGVGTVEYQFNGTVGDEANVSLQPGEETTVSFSYVVPSDIADGTVTDHGTYTNDSNRTADVRIVDSPRYTISNLSAPSIIERDTNLAATVNVTNTRIVAGDNRTVELRLTNPVDSSDVRVLNETNVSLGSYNATTVTLSGLVPSDLPAGKTTLSVHSPDDNATAPLRVAAAVGTVNGTITDAETETALSGIDVVVRNSSEVVGETVTGSEGNYTVDVPAKTLTVTGSNATYAPTESVATLTESGDVATANLSLSLRNGTLSGAVTASDGLSDPPNATVTVTNGTGHEVAAVAVDADGTYTTELRPGSYNLTANAPDFDPDEATDVTIDPNATTTQALTLDPLPATLSGTVTASKTGTPIEDATVTATPDAAGASTVETTTGAAGNYSLEAVRGQYDLQVASKGYADATKAVSLPSNGSVEANVSLVTPANFTITDFSGPTAVEQGQNAEFDVTVENIGGATGGVTITVSVSPGGGSATQSVSSVAPDATSTAAMSVPIGDDWQTGSYDATASTPNDTATTAFEVVSASTDDSTGGGGGGTSGGGGGGTTTSPVPPSTEEPTNTTTEPTNETTEPTNTTAEPTNETSETDNQLNETDVSPVNGSGGAIGPADTTGGTIETTATESEDGSGTGETGGGGDVDATAEEAGSDDGAPGFGPVIGVGAIIAAALLARRRAGSL